MDSPNQPDEKVVGGTESPAVAAPRRRRRIRVRRSWISRHYRLMLGGLVALTLVGIGLFSERSHRRAEVAQIGGQSDDLPIVPAILDHREYYPYSVIPGGVRSTEELRAAIKNDPVVAKHYADFDPDRVRFERLQKPMLMHVSYRIGSNIFWTRRMMHIKAGETILTDGVTCARGRCGNRMSDTLGKTFVPPVEELTEESFDTPDLGTPPSIVSFLPQISAPSMPILPPPIITAIMPTVVESPNEWAPVPRHIFPPALTGPGSPGIVLARPTAPADVAVPEPGTWCLVAGSLGLLLVGRQLLSQRS